MLKTKTITARLRSEKGSRASGRVRRGGEVPGILLGRGDEPVPLAVKTRDLELLHHQGAHLVTLDFGAEKVDALIREVQFDHLGQHLLHVDLDRIRAGEKIEVDIDITFFGQQKIEGAVFQVLMDEVRVRCLPGAIPDKLEADVRNMKKGDELHVRDLVLPEGVELAGLKGDEFVAIFAEIREKLEVPAETEVAEPEVLTAREKKEGEGSEEEKG